MLIFMSSSYMLHSYYPATVSNVHEMPPSGRAYHVCLWLEYNQQNGCHDKDAGCNLEP